ncbi:MAG: Sjogren's syndrome/scleroderma autoantigen 1 family protein [archaeon]|nr:Sjogren's syndrome/scleroderma autoantigen 1 family protein [archaeon]
MGAVDVTEKRKVTTTADLMRRGATLLNEACPRCGGVQIRYQGKVYCINEYDISSILSSPAPKQEPSPPIVQPIASQPSRLIPRSSPSESTPGSERDALKNLLEAKLAKVSKELESSQDFDQQAKLLELISKYLETLEKLKGSGSTAS